MSFLRRLARGQRVVLVIALGVALGAVGSYLDAWGSSPVGWVAYAPLGPATRGGLHPWVRLLLWLALTAVWAACSLVVLRPPSAE